MKTFRIIFWSAAGLTLLWAAGFLIFCISVLRAEPQAPEQTTDAIIVFTGGTGRIEAGLNLFAQGRAKDLYISGIHPDVTEEEILQKANTRMRLPPCCLILERKATTTIENAQETAEWLLTENYTSVRLVTSDYHMPRAHIELAHYAPDVRIYHHPVKHEEEVTYLNRLSLLFTEYHKVIYRRIWLLFTPSTPVIMRA